MLPVRNIAVFLPNWVGDVVMATPALRALRAGFPDARITYVGRPGPLATLAGSPDADAALADLSHQPPRGRHLLALARRLRHERIDLAVLLPNSFRTALAARLGGARRAAGYVRDGRGWLLSVRLSFPRGEDGRRVPVPAMESYIALIERLGARCESRKLDLPVTAEEQAAAAAVLAGAGVAPDRPVVMVNPGGSFGPSKVWSPRRFAALADLLADRRGAQIILNAAPAERPIAGRVVAAMRGRPAVDLAERPNSIGLVKALLRHCDLLVTNDTGARHLAAAMGTPVVTIFGSTHPEWSRIDYDRERIVRVEVPCGPCQRRLCNQPAGPQYHRCMELIGPERVLAAAEELLDAEARP